MNLMNPRKPHPLAIVGWGILLTFSYDFFFQVAYALGPKAWVYDTEFAFFDTTMCLLLIGVYGLVYWGWLKLDRQKEPWHLTVNDVWQGLILAFSVGGVSILWFAFVDWLNTHTQIFPQTVGEFDATWNYTRQDAYLWVFLSIAIFGPIAEELLFRGLIYRCFDQFKQPWVPIVVTAILFGFWHQQPVQIGYTLVAGLIFGIARAYSGSLTLPIFIHIINNTLATLPPSWEASVSSPLYFLSMFSILPAIYLLILYGRQLQAAKGPGPEG